MSLAERVATVCCMFQRLRFGVMVVVLAWVQPGWTQAAYTSVTDSFTDSRGRTIEYRYWLEDDWGPQDGRGLYIFFHGNNEGTAEQMFDLFGPSIRPTAFDHDLVPVVVASPTIHSNGLRDWLSTDAPLVHELLQGGFGGNLVPDLRRVIFEGGSGGTGFLHQFLRLYGEQYGGGFWARCGFFLHADPTWNPKKEFVDGFRVLVQATTEDFLYGGALKAYSYYKYTLGLETRGDLDAPGEHCATGDVLRFEGVAWLLHGTGLPEEADEPHVKRVSLLEYVVGIAVDADGVVWVVNQTPAQDAATLWRSVDRGLSWEVVSRVPTGFRYLEAVGSGSLFAIGPIERSGRRTYWLFRSNDGGLSFEPVEGPHFDDGTYVSSMWGPVASNDQGGLYVPVGLSNASAIYLFEPAAVPERSADRWTRLLGAPTAQGVVPDPVVDGRLTLRPINPWDPHVFGRVGGHDLRTVVRPSNGISASIAWDGLSMWALVHLRAGWGGAWPLYESMDEGATWFEVSRLPETTKMTYGKPWRSVSALDRGQLLIHGGGHIPVLRDQNGRSRSSHASWLLWGGETLGGSNWSVRPDASIHRQGYIGFGRWYGPTGRPAWAGSSKSGDVYLSDGLAIFRLGAESRELHDIGIETDADRDGVPDARDAFPEDAGEYLDTDGDGVGNSRDRDADGDGVFDEDDELPLDRYEFADADGDGMGNDSDIDDDGDLILDVFDEFPLDSLRVKDLDRDGIADAFDPDDDGDGIEDALDSFPEQVKEWLDSDGDLVGDNLDPDDDNDGVSDEDDADPLHGLMAGQSLEVVDGLLAWSANRQFGRRDGLSDNSEDPPDLRTCPIRKAVATSSTSRRCPWAILRISQCIS